jgi:hypothetical protein
MDGFHQYLAELFSQPYRFVKKLETRMVRDVVAYHYVDEKTLRHRLAAAAHSEYADISGDLDVHFSPVDPRSDEDWEVDFYRGGSTALTGGGDAGRVFASVMDAMRRFIREYSPLSITFTASKSELDGQTLSLRSGSRVRLYNSMIRRFAPQLGYEVDSEQGFAASSARNEVFVLRKKGK